MSFMYVRYVTRSTTQGLYIPVLFIHLKISGESRCSVHLFRM